MNKTKTSKDPERMIERWHILAERHDLIKEYLLRPMRAARQQAESKTSMLSPEDIKRNQVLPKDLFRAMQDAFNKAQRDCESLEKDMNAMDCFEWFDSGPRMKAK